MFPLAMSLAICRLVLLAATPSNSLFVVRALVSLIGLVWSSYASMQFLGDCQPPRRKALAAYPMFLFYFVLAWMVLSYSNL